MILQNWQFQWYLYLVNQDLWLERREEAPLVQHSGLGTYQVNIWALSFHFNTMGKLNLFFVINFNNSFASRDRPAAFPVNVTSIDDTKNFDEFPEVRFFYISQIRGLQIHLTWLQSHNFLNSWPQVQHFSWKCSILSGGARLLQGCTKQGWAEGGEGLSG